MVPIACPICNDPTYGQDRTGQVINCVRCGEFKISKWDKDKLFGIAFRKFGDDSYSRALASYYVRRAQKENYCPQINFNYLYEVLERAKLPNAAEQADEAILFFGRRLKSPEELISIHPLTLASEIGAKDILGVDYIIKHLEAEGLIINTGFYNPYSFETEEGKLGLTFKGWQKHNQLLKNRENSRKAFMAMAFGNSDLTKILNDYLMPEVRKTGFELRRLDHEPKAGLIDNLLREAITQSRFLVADLTDQNPGAYWEAGFAEGLGKPVFYMCEKSVWEKKKTHFDTEHYQTITWDKDNPEKAAKSLKASIRITLTEDAILND